MTPLAKKTFAAVGLTVLLAGVAGCSESRLHISNEFGQSVRQDVAAQVAEPDAAYKGTPDPGAGGARVGLAQDRYGRNEVIKPVNASTSTAAKGGGEGGGGSPSP